jgi:hypothetical protein
MKLKTLILATTVIFFTAASAAALDFRTENPINFHSAIELKDSELRFNGSNSKIVDASEVNGLGLLEFTDDDGDGNQTTVQVDSSDFRVSTDEGSLTLGETGKVNITGDLNAGGEDLTNVGQVIFGVEEEEIKQLDNCDPGSMSSALCVQEAFGEYDSGNLSFKNFNTLVYTFYNNIDYLDNISEEELTRSARISNSDYVVIPPGGGLDEPLNGTINIKDGTEIHGRLNTTGKLTVEDVSEFQDDVNLKKNEINNIRELSFDEDIDLETNEGRIEIGNVVNTQASNTISIGDSADAAGDDSVAIGRFAETAGNDATSIGEGSLAQNSSSIALGHAAEASAVRGIAIGSSAKANAEGSIALGHDAYANDNHTLVLGGGGNDYDFEVSGSKNFVQNVNETHEVVYTSSESAQARVEWSTSVEIEGERDRVQFPNHLKMVMSDSKGYNVQLTPVNSLADAAVYEKSDDGFTIRSSKPVEKVDVHVRGVRRGYEEKEVVRQRQD